MLPTTTTTKTTATDFTMSAGGCCVTVSLPPETDSAAKSKIDPAVWQAFIQAIAAFLLAWINSRT